MENKDNLIEEIRSSSDSPNLALNQMLLDHLMNFSNEITKRSEECLEKVLTLEIDARKLETQVKCSRNCLENLSNTQFIESKVQESEIEEDNKANPLDENDDDEEEELMLATTESAIDIGLSVLDENIDVVALPPNDLDSNSENSDNDYEELVMKPRTSLSLRPIPYDIGDTKFFQDQYVGILGQTKNSLDEQMADISSEETSEDEDMNSYQTPKSNVDQYYTPPSKIDSSDEITESKSAVSHAPIETENIHNKIGGKFLPPRMNPSSGSEEEEGGLFSEENSNGRSENLPYKQSSERNYRPNTPPSSQVPNSNFSSPINYNYSEDVNHSKAYGDINTNNNFNSGPPPFTNVPPPHSTTSGNTRSNFMKSLFDSDEDDVPPVPRIPKTSGNLFDENDLSEEEKTEPPVVQQNPLIKELEQKLLKKSSNIPSAVPNVPQNNYKTPPIPQASREKTSVTPSPTVESSNISKNKPKTNIPSLFSDSDLEDNESFKPTPPSFSNSKASKVSDKTVTSLFSDSDIEEDYVNDSEPSIFPKSESKEINSGSKVPISSTIYDKDTKDASSLMSSNSNIEKDDSSRKKPDSLFENLDTKEKIIPPKSSERSLFSDDSFEDGSPKEGSPLFSHENSKKISSNKPISPFFAEIEKSLQKQIKDSNSIEKKIPSKSSNNSLFEDIENEKEVPKKSSQTIISDSDFIDEKLSKPSITTVDSKDDIFRVPLGGPPPMSSISKTKSTKVSGLSLFSDSDSEDDLFPVQKKNEHDESVERSASIQSSSSEELFQTPQSVLSKLNIQEETKSLPISTPQSTAIATPPKVESPPKITTLPKVEAHITSLAETIVNITPSLPSTIHTNVIKKSIELGLSDDTDEFMKPSVITKEENKLKSDQPDGNISSSISSKTKEEVKLKSEELKENPSNNIPVVIKEDIKLKSDQSNSSTSNNIKKLNKSFQNLNINFGISPGSMIDKKTIDSLKKNKDNINNESIENIQSQSHSNKSELSNENVKSNETLEQYNSKEENSSNTEESSKLLPSLTKSRAKIPHKRKPPSLKKSINQQNSNEIVESNTNKIDSNQFDIPDGKLTDSKNSQLEEKNINNIEKSSVNLFNNANTIDKQLVEKQSIKKQFQSENLDDKIIATQNDIEKDTVTNRIKTSKDNIFGNPKSKKISIFDEDSSSDSEQISDKLNVPEINKNLSNLFDNEEDDLFGIIKNTPPENKLIPENIIESKVILENKIEQKVIPENKIENKSSNLTHQDSDELFKNTKTTPSESKVISENKIEAEHILENNIEKKSTNLVHQDSDELFRNTKISSKADLFDSDNLFSSEPKVISENKIEPQLIPENKIENKSNLAHQDSDELFINIKPTPVYQNNILSSPNQSKVEINEEINSERKININKSVKLSDSEDIFNTNTSKRSALLNKEDSLKSKHIIIKNDKKIDSNPILKTVDTKIKNIFDDDDDDLFSNTKFQNENVPKTKISLFNENDMIEKQLKEKESIDKQTKEKESIVKQSNTLDSQILPVNHSIDKEIVTNNIKPPLSLFNGDDDDDYDDVFPIKKSSKETKKTSIFNDNDNLLDLNKSDTSKSKISENLNVKNSYNKINSSNIFEDDNIESEKPKEIQNKSALFTDESIKTNNLNSKINEKTSKVNHSNNTNLINTLSNPLEGDKNDLKISETSQSKINENLNNKLNTSSNPLDGKDIVIEKPTQTIQNKSLFGDMNSKNSNGKNSESSGRVSKHKSSNLFESNNGSEDMFTKKSSNTTKNKSIFFDDSDEDDDLFGSSSKGKTKSKPIFKDKNEETKNNSKPISNIKDEETKTNTKRPPSKKSVFGDSSSDSDDVFGKKK